MGFIDFCRNFSLHPPVEPAPPEALVAEARREWTGTGMHDSGEAVLGEALQGSDDDASRSAMYGALPLHVRKRRERWYADVSEWAFAAGLGGVGGTSLTSASMSNQVVLPDKHQDLSYQITKKYTAGSGEYTSTSIPCHSRKLPPSRKSR